MKGESLIKRALDKAEAYEKAGDKANASKWVAWAIETESKLKKQEEASNDGI